MSKYHDAIHWLAKNNDRHWMFIIMMAEVFKKPLDRVIKDIDKAKEKISC